MSVVIAIAVMAGVTLAVHLGLPQAIAGIVNKICGCHKCLSFWSTLIVLTYAGVHPAVTALLSICMAYASEWFAIVLVLLNKLYERLWRKVRK